MPTVIDKLASSLGHRDEKPNQELAKQIASKNDAKALKELVENLNNKDKAIQSDCIKVLYEIGELKPELIAPYAKELVSLLDDKNNRLQWGAMTALNTITALEPKTIYAALPKLADIANKGSVITRDHYVYILIKLAAVKQYADNAFGLLIEQLQTCPSNQLPMYADNAAHLINDKNKTLFIKTLNSRLDDFEKETKRNRVEKLIKKLQK